jgi:hypothetical protein
MTVEAGQEEVTYDGIESGHDGLQQPESVIRAANARRD